MRSFGANCLNSAINLATLGRAHKVGSDAPRFGYNYFKAGIGCAKYHSYTHAECFYNGVDNAEDSFSGEYTGSGKTYDFYKHDLLGMMKKIRNGQNRTFSSKRDGRENGFTEPGSEKRGQEANNNDVKFTDRRLLYRSDDKIHVKLQTNDSMPSLKNNKKKKDAKASNYNTENTDLHSANKSTAAPQENINYISRKNSLKFSSGIKNVRKQRLSKSMSGIKSNNVMRHTVTKKNQLKNGEENENDLNFIKNAEYSNATSETEHGPISVCETLNSTSENGISTLEIGDSDGKLQRATSVSRLSQGYYNIDPDDNKDEGEQLHGSRIDNELKLKNDLYNIFLHDTYFRKEVNSFFSQRVNAPLFHSFINNNVDGTPLGPHTFHLNEKFTIPSHKCGVSSGEHLVATIFLSGYMYDHVDTSAYFAKYCAQYANIICSPIICMPNKIKRWKIHRSPFVKVKNKEEFESKLYTRAIQLYDADLPSVESVINFVKLRLPRAINMKIVFFDYETIDEIKEHHKALIKRHPQVEPCIRMRKEPFEIQVEELAKNLLKKWDIELNDRPHFQ